MVFRVSDISCVSSFIFLFYERPTIAVNLDTDQAIHYIVVRIWAPKDCFETVSRETRSGLISLSISAYMEDINLASILIEY